MANTYLETAFNVPVTPDEAALLEECFATAAEISAGFASIPQEAPRRRALLGPPRPAASRRFAPAAPLRSAPAPPHRTSAMGPRTWVPPAAWRGPFRSLCRPPPTPGGAAAVLWEGG